MERMRNPGFIFDVDAGRFSIVCHSTRCGDVDQKIITSARVYT